MTTAVDRLANPILTADPVDSDNVLAKDVAMADLILNGDKFSSDLIDAVQDIRLRRTVEGASTVTVTLYDPEYTLLNSALIRDDAEIVIDGLEFTMVQVNYAGASLTLTFEDSQVAKLRKFKKPRKVARATHTRAQFARMLVREAKGIAFVCPELNVRQPIASQKSKASKKDAKDPGFAKNEKFTVKGKQADKRQRINLERVLDVGYSRKMPRKVMLAAVITVIQESVAYNLSSGDRDSVGLFQQRASWGSVANRRNPEKAAGKFFDKAIIAYRQSPSMKPGDLAQEVQKSATPTAYAKWIKEGTAILNAYYGGRDGEGVASNTKRKATKKYEFTRGAPGGEKGEDTWSCLLRLADEVAWRAFCVRGAVYFISEPQLFQSAAIVTLGPHDEGVDSISFDFDIGKKVAEASLTVRVSRWAAPPGSIITLEDVGPANGRWLVSDIERSLFSSTASVTLRKPNPKLPEPAAEEESTGGSASSVNSGDKRIDKAYAKAEAIDKARYPYLLGGGHGSRPGATNGKLDCSGAVSWVLAAAGVLSGAPRTSGGLESWGVAGEGRLMTVWTNASHVFIEFKIPGKGAEHFGTGKWGESFSGAGFKPNMHHKSGFTPRHIKGL